MALIDLNRITITSQQAPQKTINQVGQMTLFIMLNMIDK